TLVGSIRFSFPLDATGIGWDHTTYALAVRPTPGSSTGDFDVFFNVGSQYNGVLNDPTTGMVILDNHGNAVLQPTVDHVTVSGLISATLKGDSIYKVTIHDRGAGITPSFSNLRQIASGLRN